MKRILLSLAVAVLSIIWANTSFALLINQGDGVLYDNQNDIYWYQNINDFHHMTYQKQIDAIATLDAGSMNWHMSKASDLNSLFSTYGYEAAKNFQTTGTYDYYSGGDDEENRYYLYFWQGRYDEEPAEGEGYHSYLRIAGGENDEYQIDANGGFHDDWSDSPLEDTWLGAWVVSYGENYGVNSVPEPSVIVLLGLSLLGLMALFQKRKDIES